MWKTCQASICAVPVTTVTPCARWGCDWGISHQREDSFHLFKCRSWFCPSFPNSLYWIPLIPPWWWHPHPLCNNCLCLETSNILFLFQILLCLYQVVHVRYHYVSPQNIKLSAAPAQQYQIWMCRDLESVRFSFTLYLNSDKSAGQHHQWEMGSFFSLALSNPSGSLWIRCQTVITL